MARVSLGAPIAQAAYAVAHAAATEVLSLGTYDATRDALDFADLNALLSA